MTTRFRKKVRRWRGRTSHGHGAKKKARGGGSLGGRGYSGRHKHKRSLITTKMGDEYFGYKGFHSRKVRGKAINLGDIEKISKGGHEVDLNKLGYSKLLSRGRIKNPVVIKVAAASARAREKVEGAGGRIIIEAEDKEKQVIKAEKQQ